MNDTKIYEQVARKPGIRASEIAANLDMTLATVSADLRSLVDAGDLVKRTEFGEQGRQCQVYELSEEFKGSRFYEAMIASMVLAPAAETVPATALATGEMAGETAAPASTAPAITGEQGGDSQKVSKVDRALACITRLGSATDDQLRDAMGLPPKTYVGAYLTSAVKSGRVLRDGDRWKPGPGNTQAKALDSVEKVGNIIVATKDASPIPQAVVDAIAAAPAPTAQPAAPKPSRCRIAVWSDGKVEIKVPGMPSLELSRTEFDEMVRFVSVERAA